MDDGLLLHAVVGELEPLGVAAGNAEGWGTCEAPRVSGGTGAPADEFRFGAFGPVGAGAVRRDEGLLSVRFGRELHWLGRAVHDDE